MSATLFKYPHIYWRYLQRKVTVTGAEMLWLRRRSIWCSAVQQTIGWLPPPDFHMKYSKNTKLASVPRAVSLIDYSIFQIKLCSCFLGFFPPKPTSNHRPVVFMNRSYSGPGVELCPGNMPFVWKVLITCQFVSEIQVAHLTIWWWLGVRVHWPGRVCSVRFISIHSLMLPDYH